MISKKEKKAVSGVITTVIMIALVIAIVGILWAVVNNLIGGQIDSSESCFGNFGEVTFNKQFTCKDSTLNETQFALNIGDVTAGGVLVSLIGESGTKSFELKEGSTFAYVKALDGAYNGALTLPGKNEGSTYVVALNTLGVSDATSIKIAPVIDNNQCEVSDTIAALNAC
jgi:flagellin-like protein